MRYSTCNISQTLQITPYSSFLPTRDLKGGAAILKMVGTKRVMRRFARGKDVIPTFPNVLNKLAHRINNKKNKTN